MKSLRRIGQLKSSLLIAVIFSACAGKSIAPVNDVALNKELTTDMVDKFAVKDVSTGGSAPLVAPQPIASGRPTLPKANSKHRAKKFKQPSPEASPTAVAFAWPERRPAVSPFRIGEKHTFEVTYFGMSAGSVDLELMPYKEMNGRKVYHIEGHARSSKVFSMFYRLDDAIHSYFDYEGLFSHRFQLILDESKQTRDSLELNDSEKGQTYYWNRWNHWKKGYIETKELKPMTPFSQDSLSALFYIRTLPLKNGDVYTIPVCSEGKVWEAQVTVVGRETLRTPLGEVQTIILKPEPKYSGALARKGDSFIWVTDDDRRYVVRLEAKVRIGTVVAFLKKIEPGRASDGSN